MIKMKSAICALIGMAVIVPAIYGLPARSNDAEVIAVVPLEKQHRPAFPNFNFGGGFDGVIDTGSDEIDDDIFGGGGVGGSYNPFRFDFGGLLHSLDDYMRRLRDRFSNVWTRVPYPDTDTDVGLGIVGNNDKGNTTSKVEIIDGHKVIVNDTVYTKNTDFGTSVVKVRTVEVVPNDDDDEKHVDTTAKPAVGQKPNPTRASTTPRDIEQDSDEVTVMSSRPVDQADNEIEMLDNSYLAPITNTPNRRPNPDASVVENSDSIEEMSANGGQSQYEQIMQELTHYQEQMDRHRDAMAQQLFYPNQIVKAPTWESFEDVFEPNRQQHYQNRPSYHYDDNDNSNKYDLTNDIAINQMLADQGAPINPDAEFIQPVQQQQQQQPQQYNEWPSSSDFYSKYETIKK